MHKQIILDAAAKINLSLGVVGKRNDGYHLLESVMQSVSLYDRIVLEWNSHSQGIQFEAGQNLSFGRNNSCYRAARAWLEETGQTGGLKIILQKRIPVEAGLGGGSADAAAVLVGLDRMHKHNMERSRLVRLAESIGADVPFCLQGGISFCEGIGEKITPLPPLPTRPLLLLKPRFGLSTPAVFHQLNWTPGKHTQDHRPILAAVRAGDWVQLGRLAFNTLQEPAGTLVPELLKYIDRLRRTSADLVAMSGSGTSVFAVYPDTAACSASARQIQEELSGSVQLYQLSTVRSGMVVVRDHPLQ